MKVHNIATSIKFISENIQKLPVGLSLNMMTSSQAMVLNFDNLKILELSIWYRTDFQLMMSMLSNNEEVHHTNDPNNCNIFDPRERSILS